MVSVRQAYTGFGKSFVNIQLAPDMRKNISKSAKNKFMILHLLCKRPYRTG